MGWRRTPKAARPPEQVPPADEAPELATENVGQEVSEQVAGPVAGPSEPRSPETAETEVVPAEPEQGDAPEATEAPEPAAAREGSDGADFDTDTDADAEAEAETNAEPDTESDVADADERPEEQTAERPAVGRAPSPAAPPTPPTPAAPTTPTTPTAPAAPQSDDLMPVDDLVEQIVARVPELRSFPQPLMEAHGLAADENVRATVSLPRFDNSAMDGYAVNTADFRDVAPGSPVVLPVVGEIGAGRSGLMAMSPGTAVKIMTGAPVPRGADAVVPYELTDRGVARVEIRTVPQIGDHIREAGEDVKEGDTVLEHGTVIGPRHLGLLAAVGITTVRTRPRPRVVVLSTGSELREPGSSLGHDTIYDANSYLLAAAAKAAGAIVYRVGIVPDEPHAFTEALSDQLVRADLVITSGGVSEGDFDVVKEALAPLGTVWFGKVAMQPGKPQGFGTIGEDDTPIFALPGNPVSAYVSFQTFVLPALRKMMGRTPYVRPPVRAKLGMPLTSPAGKRQLVRALYEVDQGRPFVTPVGGSGSHLIGDLAGANALIVLEQGTTSAAVGDSVPVLLLDQDF